MRTADVVAVTPALLREMPLPEIGSSSEKRERGSVLVCGGSRRTPGSVLLAGIAALRVGAGRLQIAVDAACVAAVAVAVPEALVMPSDEAAEAMPSCDAVLVGPGTSSPDQSRELLAAAADALGDEAILIIDAGALAALADDPDLIAKVRDRTVLMPNPTEMAVLLSRDVSDVDDDPYAALADAVATFGATTTLRAADSLTTAPGARCHLDRSGNAGLATSGSGDVAGGAIAGLAARGASPLIAAVWGTHLHGIAGARCAARIGPVGFLARELLDELPAALVAVG